MTCKRSRGKKCRSEDKELCVTMETDQGWDGEIFFDGIGNGREVGHDGNFFLEIAAFILIFLLTECPEERISPRPPWAQESSLTYFLRTSSSSSIRTSSQDSGLSLHQAKRRKDKEKVLPGAKEEGILWCNLPTSLITMDGVVVGGGEIYFFALSCMNAMHPNQSFSPVHVLRKLDLPGLFW